MIRGWWKGVVGFWSKVNDMLDAEVVVSIARFIVAGMFGIDISCHGVGDRLGMSRSLGGWPGATGSGSICTNLSAFRKERVSVMI